MRKLDRFLGIVVFGFVLSVIYHYILEKYMGQGWPYNTFLFVPSDKFMDYFNTLQFGEYLLRGEFVYNHPFINAYMPLFNWLDVPFALAGKRMGFFLFNAIIITFFIWYCYKEIIKINQGNKVKTVFTVLIITFTSYPLLFLIDRGNFEGFIFIFLGLFLLLYSRRKFTMATLVLALGASLKPFIFVFIILYLSDKKYRESIKLSILTGFLYFIELALLPGGFVKNLQYWLIDLKRYDESYVISDGGSYYCHTVYNVLNIINKQFHIISSIDLLKKCYLVLAFIIFLIVSIYILKYEKVFWRKVFLLTLVSIGLPFISNDYTLISLYIPIILFLSEEKDHKAYNTILWMSGLLIIPKQYFFTFINIEIFDKYSIATFINPILIMVLFALLIKNGFSNSDMPYTLKTLERKTQQ